LNSKRHIAEALLIHFPEGRYM